MPRDEALKVQPDAGRVKFPGRLRRFALTVIPVLAVFHLYIGWRLLPDMPFDWFGVALSILALCVSTFLMPLGMLARFLGLSQPLADRLSWLSALNMGLFSSLLVLTMMRDVFLLLPGTHALAASSALMVFFGALLFSLVGYFNARRVARVVHVDIPLSGLPEALVGFSIAQISDIHVSSTIKADYVRAIVDRVNGLGADVIAITGDVVDGRVHHLGADAAPLSHLRSRHGSFVVTGNHEYYSGAAEWVREFRRLGLHPLMNEHVIIDYDGALLMLAGVTDYSAQAFDPEQRSDPHAARAGGPDDILKILLAHQPRSAVEANAAGFDLQLSGHTHGGQFWPWNLFVTLQQPFTAGLHRMGKLWVYTSRGTGYWGPPKRFGAPSEITLLRLVPASGQ
ncbi:MAG: metallophosphoesterase [Betaproteobacteria bacterium]